MEIKVKEKESKESYRQTKNLYNALKTDEQSVFFASEKITKQLVKKAKKSGYEKDKVFVTFYNSLDNVNLQADEVVIPTYVPFVEKRSDIDRPSLYSFNAPFQLLHADIADIRFFTKSALDPHYCLLFVDLFTQKFVLFSMKKRNLLKNKMELFYQNVNNKRKGKKMRLQTDLEFQQNDIKRLNKKYDVDMFSTRTRGGKAFAAEPKIREFKKLLLKIKNFYKKNKKKIKSSEIIKMVTANMNKTKSQKYDVEPEKIEKKSLEDDKFREKYDFYRLQIIGKDIARQNRYDIKKDLRRPRKLRDPLNVGEKVLVLAERLKKKDAPGKLYKSTTQNKTFFNKNKIFIIKKRVQTTSNHWYYWLVEENSETTNKFRYLRQELYALNGQWR